MAEPRAPIIATLRYTDSNKAVDFLCRAFGFVEKASFKDEGGVIVHAELTFGQNGCIMLGPDRDTPFGRYMRQPRVAGGSTVSLFVIVDDVDAHCERARAAGAEILMEPTTQSYGGRDYSCKDIDGHLWSFGTYDPFNPPQG